MTRRRAAVVLGSVVLAALVSPLAVLADHIVTAATVDATVTARRSAGSWTVVIRWTGACNGAAAGSVAYDGDVTMIDAQSRERIYAGGVVDTSGSRAVARSFEWAVQAGPRERVLFPELKLSCYEQFPLHGGREALVTGTAVRIPPSLGNRGGPGGASGDYGGSGDPTRPPAPGGCVAALLGTERGENLRGTAAGDVVFGFGGGDRLEGRGGHDCLLGGSGNDVLRGEAGADRLTGGRGNDRLVGGPGANAYDAGPGADTVDARNGVRETVHCGSGRDTARVDRSDRVSGCERVIRPG
jgi:hypothetical protein